MAEASLDLGAPIAFRKQFARITRDALAALFLSECFYWSERHEADDGWFYKTSAEWEEETALTRRQQEHARTVLLEMGLIEAKRTGKNGMMHYRVVKTAIQSALAECTIRTNRNGGNVQTQPVGMADSYKPECTDRTNRNVRIEQSLTYKPSSSIQQESKNAHAKIECEELTARDFGARNVEPSEPREFISLAAKYPNVGNRKGALKAFLALKPNSEILTAMAVGLKRWLAACLAADQWPDLVWWLKDERWNDPPPKRKSNGRSLDDEEYDKIPTLLKPNLIRAPEGY